MLKLSTARRAACAVLLAFVALPSWSVTNNAPQITSQPEKLTTVKLGFHYAVQATDADGDTLRYLLPTAPTGATIDASSGVVQWQPQASQMDQHAFRVAVEDDKGGRAEQSFQLKVLADFCPIYPIALPKARVDGLSPGAQIKQLERGTGPGNFSWLTWTGANDAPTTARSLKPPGDSYFYVDPDDASDHLLNIGDWAQGSPGSKNSNSIRTALDELKTRDIILPVWDSTRGQGSRFDYRVQRFVTVRLLDYRLTGQGWFTFEYKGEAACYGDAPSALPQTLTTREDTPLPIVLTGTDPDGDVLTFTVLTSPAHGTLSGTAPNVTYTPAPNYHGPDAFTFRVNDGRFDSAAATIDLTVTPLNDPPLANPQTLTTVEDTPLPIVLSGSDIENDALTYTVLQAPAHGTLSGSAPNLTYTPTTNYHGPDAFTFRVNDGELDSAAATVNITVTPLNDPPVADDQQLETDEGVSLPILLTGTDPESDALTYIVLDQPAHGTLSGNLPALTYTPTAGYTGPDQFTFRVNDGALDSAPATVQIQVIGRNGPPEIVSTPQPSVNEGAVYDYDVDATDPDNDVLRYSTDREPSPSTIDAATGRLRWTADSSFVGSLRAQNTMCRLPSGPGLFDPQVSWTWSGPNGLSQYSDVYGPVVVGQFTDDNHDGRVDQHDTPDLVAMSGPGQRYLNLIDGRTGANHWSIRVDSIAQFGSPAIGDIDGDGGMEIVAEFGTRAEELRAFDADGREIWRTPVEARTVLEGGSRDAIALADLEGDGDVEIVRGRTIVEHTGQVRCSGQFHSGGTNNYALVSAVADLDGDGTQEIIAGGTVYRPDCSRKVQLGTVADGFVGIGNFDADEQAEIVLVSNGNFPSTGRLYLFNHDGSLKFGPVSFPGGGALGPPTLANVDADPYPEIGIAGQARYALFDHDGAKLWEATVQDPSSNQTGSTSFDFEADGRAEIIYSDEKNLRVYDGLTGTERLKLGNNSGTTLEYPVVVDADADGSADILIGANGTGSGIRKISSATRSWAPTRSLWNQHTYHVNNINDDGSIPRRPVASWLTHNTYRLNTFPDRHAFGQADLALFDLRLDESDGTTVKVLVTNRGLAPTGGATTARIFNGDPAQGGTLLGTLTVPVLGAGESRTLTLAGLEPAAIDDDLYATVDESNQIVECDDDNNFASAAYFVVRATDPESLFDTQRFTATVENVNAAPAIVTESLSDARINEAYRFVVEASDPDLGEGLRFELVAGPAGMAIDPVSGELRWTPGATQGGSHTVTVRVIDLGGLSAQRSFALAVPTNRPPVITSTAITSGQVGVIYSYDVDATDPDGDTLSYTFTNAPITMQIDATTGVITWTPTATGSFPVLVEVLDGRGGTATQSFTIVVQAPANRAPTIISAAPESVDERATYLYDIDATDPDNDVLAYRATVSPSVTNVVTTTGVLSWLANDARLTTGIRATNQMCREPSSASAFDPVVRWHWSGSSTLPTYDQVMNSPVVAPMHDTNGDGQVDATDTPDIAFVSYGGGGADWGNGVVRLVRGNDGQELFTVTDPALRVPSYANLAAGDLDGDGIAEIVAPLMSGGLVAINRDGSVKWQNSAGSFNWNIGGASIADLDADGSPEILLGKTVYSATGQIKWQGSAPYQGNSHASPIATISVAADLRAEPGLEVLSGPSLYSSTGTLLWRYDALGDGATAIGDLNSDGQGDIVLVAAGRVVALNANGTPMWGPVATDDGGRGGPPTIADFDADGFRDIGVASRSFYYVFGHDGRLKWKRPIEDFSSNITGSTLFDFDGDGAVEVMQADERKFRVLDGATGTVRLEMDNSNGTAYEYPVVVDADRDGSADILLVSNLYYGGPGQKGVRMISSASRAWMPTRSIWNQHAYHVDNINDDGSVPRDAVKSWTTHNTFRLNTFPDRHPLGLADLALFDLRLDETDGTAVTVLVVNRGLAPTTAATNVRIYNGDPASGGTLLGTMAVPALAAGEERTLTLSGLAANAVSTNLFARVDEAGAIDECLDDNNNAAAGYFDVRATDPGALFDTQRFTVAVANVNEAPSVASTSLPPAAVGQNYLHSIQASDPDLGDALRFELAAAPVGMSIESVSGELRWTPTLAQTGTHTVRVRVVDLGGLSAERAFDLTVATHANRAPTITTHAPASVEERATYQYDIDATDPDNDVLAYAATRMPSATQVNLTTGLLGWIAQPGLVQGNRERNLSCRVPSASTTEFDPVVKWSWTERPVLASPAVAALNDSNGDGQVSTDDDVAILFVPWTGDCGTSSVQAVDVESGDSLWEFAGVGSGSHVAVGDLDNDGSPEVVAQLAAGGTVALNADGQEVWRSPLPERSSCYVQGAPSIADLDADGSPEVLSRGIVLNSDGSLKFRHPSSLWTAALDTAVDLDLDGRQELVVSDRAFSAAGVELWRIASQGRLFAPLNIDSDPNPELAFVTTAGVSVINHDGSAVWTRPYTSYNSTPVSVGDLDGDGDAELVALLANRLRALSAADGTELWSYPVSEPSHLTGAAVFDFNGDGRQEVVFADDQALRIFDGVSGAVLMAQNNGSATASEAPVVADIDGDGSAEVLVSSSSTNAAGSYGIIAIGDRNATWVATRALWNQFAYNIDNINDDGSIPRVPARSWLTHNTFRLNTFQDRHPLGQADLALFDLRLDASSGTAVKVLATNRGLAPTAAATQVAVYNGDPDAGGTLIGTLEVPILAAGEERTLTLSGLADSSITTNLFARIDEAGAIAECLEDNNATASAYFDVRATDPAGLFDSQRFTVSVSNVNEAPTLLSTSLPSGAVNQGYRYTLQASDPDIGDGLRFELLQAPAGLTIDAVSGELHWTPTTTQAGTHSVGVRVVDLGGLSAQRNFELIVSNNQAPQITSTPITATPAGTEYRYDVEATDPEGDALAYALTQAPSGMQIDAASGLIRWTPSAAGSFDVEVRVSDARGAVALQRYILAVGAPANRAPTITSTPATTANAGRAYTYSVDATDPDNDVLSVLLPTKPAGMTLNEFTGEISWTPTPAQLGTHSVQVQVVDGRGGVATQNFQIVVSEAVPNRAPSITSVPPMAATAGLLYSYLVTAIDPDGDTLTVNLGVSPSGMTVNSSTGQISWTPAPNQIGSHPVRVDVNDGRGATLSQSFNIIVGDAGSNRPPTITSTPTTSATAGLLFTYLVNATDPDNDTLTVLLPIKPAGMTVNAQSRQISWTPTAAQLGSHSVQVQVTDGRGGTATQNFSIVVSESSGGNRPPAIVSAPLFTGKVGREYRYAVVAQDPDNDTLNYSLITAPSGMTVGADGEIRWTPTATGSLPVKVRVADAQTFVEQSWNINVVAADVPLNTEVGVMPNPAQPGGSVTITIVVEGAAAQPTVTATLDGQPLPLDPDGTTTITAPTTPGEHPLIVTVTDGFDTDTTTTVIQVADPSDTTAPTVQLLTPQEHADWDAIEISAPTAVTGRVVGADLARWVLAVQERGSSATPQLLAEGNAEIDGGIATFDPTRLLNGQYSLSLQAWDRNGNTAFDTRILRVTGDMKLGHYSITFEEVSIPVAGIPVTVSRTYDTRRASQSLDFGHGWTVGANNVRVQESRRVGFAWDVFNQGGTFGQRCIRPLGDPIVTVTLPDGDVASFKARAQPECRTVFDPDTHVQLVFDSIDGTDHKLEQTDYGTVRWGNIAGNAVGILFDELSGDTSPIDPRNYRLTTDAGMVFEIDQLEGVRKVTDLGTETSLIYSRDGVHHSSGIGIDFVRDARGRIEQLQLPDGETIDYRYTAAGDLEAVIDQVEETTSFGYVEDPRYPHYLRDIIDPRGIRVSRNEYDPISGRLIATIDADGHRVEYTHELVARTQTIKDRRGNRTTYAFDESGRVLTETNALGETIARTYDGEGNILTETDPLQHTTTRTYDARGNMETETNALQETTTATYNAKNQVLTQKDAALRTMLTSVYDTRSNQLMTSMTDAMSQVTTFGYVGGTGIFGTGQLESITDASGARTSFGYDFEGYKDRDTNALNHSVRYVNDDLGRVTSQSTTRTVVAADGSSHVETLTTTYTLDDKGRTTAVEHPDGSVTTTEYNGNDQPTLECDGLQRCTQTQYDDRGNVDRVDYPDATFELRTYDPNGNLDSQTDRAGRTTKFVYDAANRLTDTIHPDPEADDGNDANNPRSTNRYDAAGRLEESVDENRQVTRYRYDNANRRTQVIRNATTTAGQATMVDDYDVAGRRTASTDAEGHRTEYRYDAAGRLTEIIHPDPETEDGDLSNNPRSRIEYDAVGRKIAEVDEQQRTTRYDYDKVGRLTTVVLANPVTAANPPLVNGVSPDAGTLTTRYRYDEVGNKIEQIDAEGRRTRFEYDAMGRETARVLPEGQRETKEYNDAGELVAHTDFNGKTTRYRYDDAGSLEHVDYPVDADVSMQSNGVGERNTVTDARGTSSTEFDRRGRVVQSRDADGGLIDYEYDPAGNLLARISPSQSLVYTYDARNRLETVTRTVDGEAPTVTRYEYDQDGNRRAMVGGDGIRTEYGYDRRHRLTNLVKKTAAGAVLLAMQYTVDASGIRTDVSESDVAGQVRSVEYEYDATKRLTKETIDHRVNAKDRISSWTYDDVGNRLSQSVTIGGETTESTTYVYDNNDRVEQEARVGGAGAGTTTFGYDDNGNTLTKSGPDGATTYAYDDADRLVQAATPQGTTFYVYTADGLRVRQTVTPVGGSATTTWYVQDSAYPYAEVIEEYTSQGSGPKQLAATFTFADDLVSQTRYDAAGTPSTRFVQGDGFGSTRWLTNASGTITDSIDYDAFGNEIGRTGSTTIEHLYRGEAFDPNVGFYYLRARYMNPSQGRFMGMDSFAGNTADPTSLHRYLYANANPVSYVDPTGMFSLGEMSVAQDIRMTLANIQTEVGMGLLDGAMSRGETDPASYLAAGVIWGAVARIAPKAIGLFFRRGCKPNSFEGDTLVHTERGLVPIELVTVDDRVWGWNAELDREGWYEVGGLIQGESQYLMVSLLLSNGEVLTATENHPFYVVNPDPARADQSVDENGALPEGPHWINAGHLKEGDLLRLRDGVFSQVIGSIKEVRSERVFNITVEDAHTYYVGEGGVLTHNIACRVPKLGGSYYDVRKAYKGQGGEVNHIPPDFATGSAISYNKGPAIFMVKDDHRQLLSTTSATHRLQQQRLIAQGKFDDAFDLDVTDIQNQFGAKYDQAIDQARFYCREQGWCKR